MKLTNILSELLLTEALPPSIAKEYTSIKRNKSIQQRLDSIFSELSKLEGASTSKRGDRVYFPFSTSGGMITHESPVKKEVETALQGTDFKLKDYKMGVVTDKYGRETKLGKALSKIGKPDLVNKFNGDKTRESAKKTDFIIVFSKHPYDIVGMSTDRGWTSCMDLYDDELKKYVKTDTNKKVSWDVKEGSFVCYLTKPEDTNLNKPTGRILVKPYVNVKDKKDVIYSPEQKIYGTAPNQFLSTVNGVLTDLQGEKVGTFKLSQKLYCDTGTVVTKYPKPIQDIFDGKTKPKDKSEVEEILNILGIKNYTVNSDLTVDVDGGVSIPLKSLRAIPVQFRTVSGEFWCSNNEFRTLEGSPQSVGGDFLCSGNKLTSLKGAPQKVGDDFICKYNQLSTLEGAPQSVDGDFICTANQLTSLKGAPQLVGGSFDCSNNQLRTLEGAPQKVGGDFYCSDNQLRTLQGAPKKVGGVFSGFDNDSTLPQSEIDWVEKNIKAAEFDWG